METFSIVPTNPPFTDPWICELKPSKYWDYLPYFKFLETTNTLRKRQNSNLEIKLFIIDWERAFLFNFVSTQTLAHKRDKEKINALDWPDQGV